MTKSLLKALAETVTDPRWRIIAFMEYHGGFVTREALEAWRKVSKPWADNKLGLLFLDNVIEVDQLGRLRLKPVEEWKFGQMARTHRLEGEVQLGLGGPADGVHRTDGTDATDGTAGPPRRAVGEWTTVGEVRRSMAAEIEIDPDRDRINRQKEISSRVLRSGSDLRSATGTRHYILMKLKRIPALEQEILRPTTDNHFRMSQMLFELEQRDPDGLEGFLGGLAENVHTGLARNPAAIANKWMTERLASLGQRGQRGKGAEGAMSEEEFRNGCGFR